MLGASGASGGSGAGPVGREILLDGAHNPGGATVLAAALDDLRPFLAGGADRRPPPLTLVTAVMGDKDVAGVVGALSRSRALAGGRVVCTSLPEARALAADDLAGHWAAAGTAGAVVAEPDPILALRLALAGAPGPIVVAGSLYLVGAVRAALVRDPALADPDDPTPAAGAREWRR
jgi:dihydrofolate synthase/folylpolyglutamate synthase